MRDITNYIGEISLYGGSEIKKTYYIDNKKYMVKFPDPVINKLVYLNNTYSEYIGCKIFELFNIPVQNVELVKCTIDNKDKIAVMCEDFLKDNELLGEFKNIFLSLNVDKKYTSNLNDIFEMINKINNFIDKDNFEYKFWCIFIVDTLIENVDRHLGNWGLIKKDNYYRLSPVYDCGSSLHPTLSINDMNKLLNSNEIKNVAINLKTAYKLNDKTLNYIDIYELMPELLKKALNDIYNNIDMNKIKNIIDNTECDDIMKEFYYKTILIRKTEIIDKYYKKINHKND